MIWLLLALALYLVTWVLAALWLYAADGGGDGEVVFFACFIGLIGAPIVVFVIAPLVALVNWRKARSRGSFSFRSQFMRPFEWADRFTHARGWLR